MIRAYAVALTAVAAAVTVRRVVQPWIGDYAPLATLYGAVAVAVWFSGWRAAMVAAVLGYVATDWFFILPAGNFAFLSAPNLIGLALYLFSCSLIAGFGEALRRERRRAQALSSQMQIATSTMAASVAQCSRDMVYLWVNKQYSDWIKIPVENLIGRPIADVVGPEAFEQLLPYYRRVLAGETVHYEKEVQFRGVAPTWISATYTPTRNDDGDVDGWVSVVLDINERKQIESDLLRVTEALRDGDRKKDEFLAMLSHELRNPLAPIGYAAEILKKDEPSRAQLTRARDVIDRQVRHMGRLLDDLMDVARITRGAIVLRRQPAPLEFVVNDAVEACRPLIEQQRHTLHVDVPSQPLMVDGDTTRLSQVLTNLLNNAAKYTEPGGSIEVSATQENGSAVIRVRDSGVGIVPEMVPRVFELFAQEKRSIERSRGGLGIGLTLARHLVELHGGTLEAHSDGAGFGSEFTITLPVAEEKSADATGTSPEGTNGAHPMRILVVDDNEDAVETMAMYLSENGHDVRTAGDGLEAVQLAALFQPAAVLLDIGLPKLNGYDAAARIRARHGSDIMLVALTGWGQDDDRRRSREAGFDHHLTKPVELDELKKLLATARIPAPGP